MYKMVESLFSKFMEDKVRMLSVQDRKGTLQVHVEIHQVQQRLSSAIIVKVEGTWLDSVLRQKEEGMQHDPRVVDGQISQIITHNVTFQTDDLDAYDSDCDDNLMTSNNVYFIASFIPLIIEYLVKVNEKARILELKRRYFKDYCFENEYVERQYAVFKLYGNKIFWKISNMVPTPGNPQYAEVVLSYNGWDVPTRQILDSRGAIPSKTADDAKVVI
ncbi:hypothetical protein Tco_1419262 [Tanacetum coccineum]